MYWTCSVAKVNKQWRTVLNTVMNLPFFFLFGYWTLSFSTITWRPHLNIVDEVVYSRPTEVPGYLFLRGSSSPSASSVWGPYRYRRYCRCGSPNHLSTQAPPLHQTEGIFGKSGGRGVSKEALFSIKGGKFHYKLCDLCVQKWHQFIY
jgi:hypothetical protein